MSEPIVRIELFHVQVPLPDTFYPTWIPRFPQTQNSFTLIRLTTKSGIVGHSAGVAMDRERQGLGNLLGPYLLGADALDIDEVAQRVREASYLGWRNAWLEAACWDIKAKAEGKPLYRLLQRELGLAEQTVEQVRVYYSMGEQQRGDCLHRYIEDAWNHGVSAVKVRVHHLDESEDIGLVREARQSAGDEMALMVDANQGWRVNLLGGAPLWDLERATRFGRVCDELGYRWIEEPLDMYDYDAQAELRRRLQTPIAGGELNAGWHEFAVMLEKGSYDIYQPDVTLAGGVTHALSLMEAIKERPDVTFSPHAWTTGIGLLVNLQVYAAWPRKTYLEYPFQPPGWVPKARDGLLVEPVQVNPQGTINVPQVPGIGIEIDEKALRKHGRRFYNLTPARLALKTIKDKGIRTALELAKIKKQGG